jgi:hypothetical protein
MTSRHCWRWRRGNHRKGQRETLNQPWGLGRVSGRSLNRPKQQDLSWALRCDSVGLSVLETGSEQFVAEFDSIRVRLKPVAIKLFRLSLSVPYAVAISAMLSARSQVLELPMSNPSYKTVTLDAGSLWVGPEPLPLLPGETNIGGNLTVKGNTTIQGSVETTGGQTVDGDQIVTGDSTVRGDSNVDQNLTVKGDANFGQTLTVGGATSTNGITNTGEINTGTFSSSGDARVGGNAAVTGTLTSGGQTVNGDQTVTGDSNVGQTLTVGGATNTNGITNTGAINTGSLVVGAPPPLPPVEGQLWVNGQLITGNGIQSCAGAVPASSICIGENASWSGQNATVVGASASAVDGGTAIGAQAQATDPQATAIGFRAIAADPGTAVGALSVATGADASAFGFKATATGSKSVAIGTGATAAFDRSVAIGPGATTTAPNQVVIGTTGSRLTLPGVASEGAFVGSANQEGETRMLTTDGKGNIGTSTFDPLGIENSIRSLGVAVKTAGAMASAFSAVPQLVASSDETMRCGAGIGSMSGSIATALGCAVKLNQDSPVHLNAAISLASSVDYGYGSFAPYSGRIGFSIPLGPRQKSSRGRKSAADVKDAKLQMTELNNVQSKEIARLRDEIEKLKETLR